MKNILRIALVLAMLCMVAVASAEVVATYTISDNSYVDAVGWYFNYDEMLVLTGENTYDLYVKTDIFGTTDPGVKGNKTIIYSGTCTVAPAADGETSHLDITIDTVDNVYLEQHGKAFGRQENINFACAINTAAWTDDMADIAMVDDAAEFVGNYQALAGKVITVEDVNLDLDDVTLNNRILEMIPVEELDIQ